MTASTPTTATSLEAATAAFATTLSVTSAAPSATTAPPATTATGSPRWNFAGHPKFNGRCSDRSTNAELGASPKTYHDEK